MTTSRKARGLAAVGALALLALAAPELASGHSGSASVSCTGAGFSFSNFEAGSNTIHYVVTVDQTTAAQGDFVLNKSGGKAGSLQVPLSVSGTHTVTANASWGPAGTVGGETRPANSPPLASQVLSCPVTAPVPAPAPPAPAPVVAPAPAPAAAPAPAIAVQGAHAASPARIARLSTASVCTSRHVRVSVVGRSLRQVSVSLNGHHARTVKVRSGQRTVRVSLRLPKGAVTPMVRARVSFSNGAKARTLVAAARRCSTAVVQPQFTG